MKTEANHPVSWRYTSGFTLVELLVVLVVVAILASLAIPAYQSSVQKGRRSDATTALRSIQFAEEKYRANNSSYSSNLASDLSLSTTSDNGYYTLAVSNASGTGYTATATAVSGSSQAQDSGCTTITLQQSGATLTSSPSTCWSK